MAGWLAGNLRIITGIAVAYCAYVGTDYGSSKDTPRNVERLNFLQDSSGPEEINLLNPGERKPEIAKKYFKKANGGAGGGVTGLDKLFEEIKKQCEENPIVAMLEDRTRRYCRLYGSVEENISGLIKYENKHVLLSTDGKDDAGGKAAWEKYKRDNHPGEKIDEKEKEKESVPSKFKDLCKTKTDGTVYDISDKKYQEITKYCVRNKTIRDVLDEKKIKLLDTDSSDSAGQNRFNEYKSTNIGERFRKNQTISSKEDLKNVCLEVAKLATTVSDYKNIRSVAERYCKE